MFCKLLHKNPGKFYWLRITVNWVPAVVSHKNFLGPLSSPDSVLSVLPSTCNATMQDILQNSSAKLIFQHLDYTDATAASILTAALAEDASELKDPRTRRQAMQSPQQT
eukprot:352585-Hanusia_phi.AAC.1